MNTRNLLSVTNSLLFAALLLPGCGDDGDDTGATDGGTTGGAEETTEGAEETTEGAEETTEGAEDTTGGDEETTFIRVIHLGVGVPGVDVFANGGPDAAVAGLEFRQGTGYLALPPAEYSFDVAVADAGVDMSVLSAGPLALDANVYYTAAAVGDFTGGDPSELAILPLVDDLDVPEDVVRLQITHAAPGVGEVDIWNVTPGGDPALLLEDVDYTQTGTIPVPSADYVIGLDVDNDEVPDLTYNAGLATLGVPNGTFVNVFASQNEDAGVDLVALVDSEGEALVVPIPANP
jgi:hypothetical protein